MPVFTRSDPITAEMEQELFQMGHRNLRAHMLGNTGLSCLVVLAVWPVVPHGVVQAWLAMILVLSVLFLIGWLSFHRRAALRPVRADTLGAWRATNFGLVALAGVGWGLLGLLFVKGEEVNNLIVMTSFAGALAYSASSNVYDLRGFYTSVLLATTLLLTRLPHAFGEHAVIVGGMCVLYLFLLCLIAHSSHRTLTESIRLRVANEELARQNAEQAARAVKANREKSEFLAAASHDLRQPVHALMLLIEAHRQSEPQAAKHPLLKQIAIAGQAVGDLFHALMEFSRLESGAEKPVLVPLQLSEFLLQLHERWLPQAHRKQLDFRCRLSKRTSETWILCDKVLLERVVGNLLSNAIRYTPAGGVLLALRPASAGQGAWLEVWDTGVGITEVDRERIFDPYVQIGNQERDRTKGLGLGLSIVRHASSLLGLCVGVKSCLGRGSCFRVLLPQACILESAAGPETAAAHAMEMTTHGPDHQLKGRRILLVDDDPMVVQALSALLNSWGMELRQATAGNPDEVLQSMEAGWSPEAILSDYRLPGSLQGIELLDFLLDQFPGAIGLLQTGELAQNVQARADEAGYLVLFKPVSPSVLARTLLSLLEARQGVLP